MNLGSRRIKRLKKKPNIAHGGYPDAVLMMAATCEDKIKGEEWYLDYGCSNHMTSHREWLTNFDASKKTSIKLVDSGKLASEGSGNMGIKRAACVWCSCGLQQK